MVDFAMDVGSFQVVVGNLQAVAKDEAVIDALGEALSAVLFREVSVNLSYTDHSLSDLRDLDHPYAKRHGSIKVHGGNQRVVHKQSGVLLNSLRVEKLPSANSPTGEAYAVWFDLNDTWVTWSKGSGSYAAFVVQGTKYMLPRDVLWATTKDPRVRKAMMKAATRTLGPALRSKANVRFQNS